MRDIKIYSATTSLLSLFYLVFISIPIIGIGQNRSMYVDDFQNILGNTQAENQLLNKAQQVQTTTLLLYDLYPINNNLDITNDTSTVLSNFIKKAKDEYDIEKVGAIGENPFFFKNVIDVYNNKRTDHLEKFDIYNLEFEAWNTESDTNQYICNTYLMPLDSPCTNQTAYSVYVDFLDSIKTIANNNNTHPITVETYIGFIDLDQVPLISQHIDHILIAAYAKDPFSAVDRAYERITSFQNEDSDLPISVILSTEPDFMKKWSENHSIEGAEMILQEKYPSQNLHFTYFPYSYLDEISLKNCDSDLYIDNLHIQSDTLLEAKKIHITNYLEIDQVNVFFKSDSIVFEETNSPTFEINGNLYMNYGGCP